MKKTALYVKKLLDTDRLEPGERLPAERMIAQELGVSRASVRLALERLEYYGVIKTYPQSGSLLANHPKSVIQNQLSNIMEQDSFDFYSLVSVRTILEIESVRRCAENRTEEDLKTLHSCLQDFIDCAGTGLRDEKDFVFHASIAKASHNPVLYTLLLTIMPEVQDYYRRLNACSSPAETVIAEHRDILECIEKGDPDAAEESLRRHFSAIDTFAARHYCRVPRTRI